MSSLRTLAALAAAALATACATPDASTGYTSSPVASAEHAGHAGAAAMSGPMADMEPRMQAMREMHLKMKNARTPQERSALMAEHMKAMQGGMSMMTNMSGKGGGMMAMMGSKPTAAEMAGHHQMMGQHMRMMQMMMDMMADRMPPAPGAP